MPSIIDQLIAFKAANPTAKLYVEEALIRGAAGDDPKSPWGVVKGAHFTIALVTLDPLGKPHTQILGPFPASLVPADAAESSEMGKLLGINAIQAQATLDAHLATIDDLQKQLETSKTDASNADAVISRQQATVADLQKQLQVAQAETHAAQTQIAALSPE